MKNKIKLIASYVVVAMTLLTASVVVTSCNDDGNETISLEFGNIRQMILGRWYTVGGGWWEFSNGTYIRSDYPDRTFKWSLPDSHLGGNEAYFDGIYLNGDLYDIISLGGDSWVMRGHNGGSVIELGRDQSSGASPVDNNSGASIDSKMLIGKWILRKVIWPYHQGDDENYTNDNHWVQFLDDFTAKKSVYNLLESESFGSGTWKVSEGRLYFGSDCVYVVRQLDAKTLVLGWLEEGDQIEISTFEKADTW